MGDYGQWLMTSRAFLGESVPAYRNVSDVPPLVPAVLSAIRAVVPDPFVALHVLGALCSSASARRSSFWDVRVANRWGGALTVVIGLLVTDRFTDLFAFGGMLQVAALSSAAWPSQRYFARRATRSRARVVVANAAALALAAITHIGTGMIAVPAALAALVAAVTLIRSDWDGTPRPPPPATGGLAFAVICLYWLLVLVPASGDYVTNPASLAYRGPDRLWVDLFEHWPTRLSSWSARQRYRGAPLGPVLRRLDAPASRCLWAVLPGGLAWSLVNGSATDFPRFATPLVAPLWLFSGRGLRSLAVAASRRPAVAAQPQRRPAVAVVLAVVITAPRSSGAVRAAGRVLRAARRQVAHGNRRWIEAELPEGTAVLADVREGKWIEGLSGLPALFNQPVRYAFRPGEWQRNADADALMRST